MDGITNQVWPRGHLTLEGWEALPQQWWYRRTEVAEGVLMVWPGPPGISTRSAGWPSSARR